MFGDSHHRTILNCRFLAALLLLLTFSLPYASAQKYYFEQYSSKNGLSASKIYTVIQDVNDFVWLGTGSGVTRFDGTKFENFSTSNGLAPGGVKSILEDSQGRIWLGHIGGGLTIFENDYFTRASFSTSVFSSNDSLEMPGTEAVVYNVSGDITSIKEYDGNIWLATSLGGAIRLSSPESEEASLTGQQYLGPEGLSNMVFGFFISKNGSLYCITDLGLRLYDYSNDRFDVFSPAGLTKGFNKTTMFEDSKGNTWFGTYNDGLYKLNAETGVMDRYDTRNGLWGNFVTYITEDYRGNVWVASMEDKESRGGITVFTPEGTVVYNRYNGLQALHILCMIEDKEKNILIADRDAGLFIYKGDHFAAFTSPEFLPSNDVYSISQDPSGRYWFGTRAGLSVYNPSGTESEKVKMSGFPIDLQGSQINIVRSDNEGHVWIVTSSFEVFRYDIASGTYNYDLELNSNFLQQEIRITAAVTDNDNNLWLGTDKALIRWNESRKEIETYTQIKGLTGNNITTLFFDSKNTLWIGTEQFNGLTKHPAGGNQFTEVNFGTDVKPTCITETPDSTIWVGTIDGLYGLRADTVWKKVNETDGLLMNSINLLQADNKGNLYIGTNIGLNRMDLETFRVSSFTERNGFTGIETRPNASYADKTGNLWFGTSNGAIRLSPYKLPPVAKEPSTHIWRTLVNLETYPMYDGIRLSYSRNRIIFDFFSICLVNPETVKYQYFLEGDDKDWVYTDQNSAKYSSLSPGKYTFKVKASNSDGYWSQVPVELNFTIKTPFYRNPWFILSCVLLMITFIYLYIKNREHKLVREKEILEEKVEERTTEVVSKSIELQEKNRDITASIRYAERIQRAMLPPENYYNDTFVLFMPKDIVSGDFYWMYDAGDKQFVAVVDCTGHGVPGAFMSIIGHNSLNKIVKESGIRKPSEILDHLNIEVVHALLQRHEKAVRDGMDISIISFDTKNRYVEFAGAYQPLYLVRNSEVIIYKPDRFPIGMIDGQENKVFTNTRIEVQKGDMLYLFTDGYADQFGGEEEKKFKTINIRCLLSEICNCPEEEQKRLLEKTIREWMGDLQQVDDILFVGTRVP